MKKLLITGFDPFGGEQINPSWEAVKELPDHIGEYQITKIEIPTVFGAAAEKVLTIAAELAPDVIISVGQAGGRKAVTPEVIGINLREARIPDNRGNQPANLPVIPNEPDAYFSTLPVREMVGAICSEEIPAALSYSAGAFVCNDTLYRLLRHFEGTSTRVGFVHVPYLPQQAKDGVPSMELEQITGALRALISALDH